MAGKPFALVGVNTNLYTKDKLKQVMEKENLPWRSLVDVRAEKGEGFFGPVAERWNLEGTPTLYVLDHKGVIRYRWLDSPGTQVMDAALTRLVQEAEKAGKQEPK